MISIPTKIFVVSAATVLKNKNVAKIFRKSHILLSLSWSIGLFTELLF